MEDSKVFDAYFELPDGYQVQLMVLQDFPGGRARRGGRMSVYRSRVWVGHEAESDPLAHRSQEHQEMRVAIDACYSMLLASARNVVDSPVAIDALQQRVHEYFSGAVKVV